MSRTDPAPREESTRIGTDPGHLEAMLTAASDRENAASLSPVVVSGMAMDSLAVIERLQRDLSEARRDAHEERQRSDDYRAALEEARRERDEARAETGRVKANIPEEPGANPRFYQAHAHHAHRILDPEWEWRGLSVVGAAKKRMEELASLEEERGRLVEARDQGYRERNLLVAALTRLYPSCIGYDPEAESEEWKHVVFVELPTGQCSWHVHATELEPFRHLEVKDHAQWDGHTTEHKYERLALLDSRHVDDNAVALANAAMMLRRLARDPGKWSGDEIRAALQRWGLTANPCRAALPPSHQEAE